MSQTQYNTKRNEIIKKFVELKNNLINEANREYQQNHGRIGGEQVSDEQYEEIMLQINYDIAWQIFDEVNQMNDTFVLIDLTCLDTMDAQAVTKQKIYDLAQVVQQETQDHNIPGMNDHVLCVVCTDEHFYKELKGDSGKNTAAAPLKNGILEMVKGELKLDHYYISQSKTILIRVNIDTLSNPILKDW